MRLLKHSIICHMKLKQIKLLVIILAILLLLVAGYYYWTDISRAGRVVVNKFQPCQRPITYSIANLDAGFAISREELLEQIKIAENIWEQASGRDLFSYTDDGDLEISLFYDARQKATDDLKKIGLVINNDRSTFDTLKIKYDSLLADYNQQKAKLDILVANYELAKSAYEKDVTQSNGRGGASPKQFEILEQRRVALDDQARTINQTSDSLNVLVANINSIEIVLNKLIATLNLKINSYNSVASSNGQQFNEGEYISNAGTTRINIYQFSNQDELVSVLAHELGHALGMEHVDEQQAIMYYLNERGSENLTPADLEELKRVCRIK